MQIKRSFCKPIYKTFVLKQNAQRWSAQTKNLIEIGQLVDTFKASKFPIKQLLKFYELEVSSKKRSQQDPFLIRNISKYEFVNKMLNQINISNITEFCDYRLKNITSEKIQVNR